MVLLLIAWIHTQPDNVLGVGADQWVLLKQVGVQTINSPPPLPLTKEGKEKQKKRKSRGSEHVLRAEFYLGSPCSC
jgi:hypothetical protein